ncbi:MAG: hypothetical protein GPJ52_01640 [Candidatus Heimdallarchaeota archaeon]|nr:hypothetical protein [Candidatus Heimdallarchaeota archaeon]
MTKNVINHNIWDMSEEERNRVENEFKSNLRYSWQKSIAYALAYKATIEKVMEELITTFQNFIPKNHPLKELICEVITSTFKEVLGRLFTSDDIADIEIENDFIKITTAKVEGILF